MLWSPNAPLLSRRSLCTKELKEGAHSHWNTNTRSRKFSTWVHWMQRKHMYFLYQVYMWYEYRIQHNYVSSMQTLVTNIMSRWTYICYTLYVYKKLVSPFKAVLPLGTLKMLNSRRISGEARALWWHTCHDNYVVRAVSSLWHNLIHCPILSCFSEVVHLKLTIPAE